MLQPATGRPTVGVAIVVEWSQHGRIAVEWEANLRWNRSCITTALAFVTRECTRR